ncbi:MAG: prolyl oligopeptidase family serine peptidase, partial [Planctomycetia bacterium]
KAAATALDKRMDEARSRVEQLGMGDFRVDVDILRDAIDYAVAYNELYAPRDVEKGLALLSLAEQRLNQLLFTDAPWSKNFGLTVRGFRSKVDGSTQPYGVVVPDGLNMREPVPLYVFLHGRGDKQTNLGFLTERLKSPGQIAPGGGITIHPFGRFCNAYKFAGETDVFEAVAAARKAYNIDPKRIVLVGFSMGGAGAWHLAAHHPDKWAAVSPGAGFVDVKRYQKLDVAKVPDYQQKLWGLYDVPDYVRNLYNLPVVAYNGEDDKQRASAEIMLEAFKADGQSFEQLIGPKTGHAYHPEVKKELVARLRKLAADGMDPALREIHLQTRTLRYNRVFWIEALGLAKHWSDARLDAVWPKDGPVDIKTVNVERFRLYGLGGTKIADGTTVIVDGKKLTIPAGDSVVLTKTDDGWATDGDAPAGLRKTPGLQGPMDDVFYDSFLVVEPTGRSSNEKLQRWAEYETARFRDRWTSLFRGRPRWKKDREVTPED